MRKLWAAGIAVALAVLWLAPPGVSGAAASESDQARLERYAATTWASFVAMVDTPSGLPTDQLHADGSTDPQTSVTNIGAYLWSAVAAERLGPREPQLPGPHSRREPAGQLGPVDQPVRLRIAADQCGGKQRKGGHRRISCTRLRRTLPRTGHGVQRQTFQSPGASRSATPGQPYGT